MSSGGAMRKRWPGQIAAALGKPLLNITCSTVVACALAIAASVSPSLTT